jgi:hypothetical protein
MLPMIINTSLWIMYLGKKFVLILFSNCLLLIFLILIFLMDNIHIFSSNLWFIVIKLEYFIKVIKIVSTIF